MIENTDKLTIKTKERLNAANMMVSFCLIINYLAKFTTITPNNSLHF